jgi:hypothetical protein
MKPMITPHEIAQMTEQEQCQLERHIGEHANPMQWLAHRQRCRAIRAAIDEQEYYGGDDERMPILPGDDADYEEPKCPVQ